MATHDISEQGRTERALVASEAMLRGILDNIGIGVALISPRMEILELNRKMREWFPSVDPDRRNICFATFNCPPREDVCEYCPTARTLEDGLVHESETETPQEGGVRNYRIVSSPVHDASGTIVAAIEMVEDITQKRIRDTRSRQAQKMEAIGQLAGGVAHDFNNVLQVIYGNLQLIERHLYPGEELSEELVQIQKASEKAARLTRKLLMFSNQQDLDLRHLDLNQVTAEGLKMIRRVIGEHIQVDFVPGQELGCIHADAGSVDQVLMNLCINARDAMPRGGKLTVETQGIVIDDEYCGIHEWARPGRYLILSVTDTGHGMDRETQAHIFEPFYTTKGIGEGTGLGLSTVYGIINQHGGMISVYSEVGGGTVFRVYWPLVESDALEGPGTVVNPIEGGTETIMVAEDDEGVRTVVLSALEGAGYTVLLASDGEEAVKLLQEHAGTVSLVLLDVVMPKLGGLEAFEQMKKIAPELRGIYTSGYPDHAISSRSTADEGVALIQKPYDARDLLRSIREVLGEVGGRAA